MKRFFSVLIPLAMIICLFSVFVSCSAADTAENFDDSLISGDMTFDLDGFECKIRVYEYYALSDESLLSYKKDSAFYDVALARINEIENKYNCKISTENKSEGGIESSFLPAIASGNYVSDVIMQGDYDIRPKVEAKLFEPLSLVSDVIDYTNSEKWGTPYMLEWMAWDGELYGVTPMLWPDYYITSFSNIFVFNEEFAQRLGQTDPREYVENGTWSRETLESMMTTYTYTDGDIKVKTLAEYPGHFVDQALRSNNAQIYKVDGNSIVSGYHTTEGTEALEWANNFFKTYADCIWANDGDEGNYKHFINKDAALLLTYASYVYGSRAELSYEVDNYCVLPFPNGPERANQGYTAQLECVKNTIMFPLNGKDVTASAFICNELFNQLGDYDEEALKEYYLRFYFHDERDYNTLMEIAKNARFTYYADGFRGLVVDKINGSSSVAQILESSEDNFNDKIQERVVSTVQTMNEIFGDDWDK